MVTEDRLSALPDEVLQAILACLPTTAVAARTSVLSRRWCGLWTSVPALSFSSTADAVDAALHAYSAFAALNRLAFDVDPSNPAPRIAQWLCFATLRGGTGARGISMGRRNVHPRGISMGHSVCGLIELLIYGRVTRIELTSINFQLGLPSAGALTSLRTLRINAA